MGTLSPFQSCLGSGLVQTSHPDVRLTFCFSLSDLIRCPKRESSDNFFLDYFGADGISNRNALTIADKGV